MFVLIVFGPNKRIFNLTILNIRQFVLNGVNIIFELQSVGSDMTMVDIDSVL